MVNQARFSVQNESFKCKYGLNEGVCNSKQNWNHDDCRCECKELDDRGSCEKGYMWNRNTCDCDSSWPQQFIKDFRLFKNNVIVLFEV